MRTKKQVVPEWKRERIKELRFKLICYPIMIIIAILGTIGWGMAIFGAESEQLTAGATSYWMELSTKPEAISIVEEETEVVEEAVEPDQEDVYTLAKIIEAESGADYVSDECNYLVGSVVLNRVHSDLFPNDLESVITQRGQFAPAFEGGSYWTIEPDARSISISTDLLVNGSRLPDEVLYFANFKQGTVYCESDGVYFCYGDNY